MYLLQKSNAKVSSRKQIDIQGVRDGVLLLPNNQYRLILKVSAINFELKSEDEQDALIDTYQSFLNSLSCGLQILIRVREMDMEKYVHDLKARLSGEKELVYRDQITYYTDFVSKLARNNRILARHFYVVVPYEARDETDFEYVKEQLYLNCDIVGKGLARLGMQTLSLSSLEVLDLFYAYYNPAQSKRQPLSTQAFQLYQSSFLRKQAI
jgi:hypothetical protein